MKARYIFGLALLFGLASIVFLRANAQHALELKNQILQKDQAAMSVTADIISLQKYVFKHMNSSIEFKLDASYNRAAGAVQPDGINGKLYAEAQATCDIQGNTSVIQAQCVQAYLNRRLGANQNPLKLPLESQYVYAYAAPGWSPDLAGLSVLATVLLGITSLVIYSRGLMRSRSD